MFTYSKERELQDFVIENFDQHFGFEYTSSEFTVTGGRVDILGSSENTIYVVELKRDFISDKTIQQLSNYLPEIRLMNPGKEVLGIAAAPSLEKGFSEESLPADISILLIEGVEYVPTPNNKIKVTLTLDQDITEKAKELSEKESRSVSQQINKILKEYFEQMATQK